MSVKAGQAQEMQAVHVKEYGVVEAEGAPGYHSAHISLRAPRVAVRVESAQHWQSMFALAMWMAAGWCTEEA